MTDDMEADSMFSEAIKDVEKLSVRFRPDPQKLVELSARLVTEYERLTSEQRTALEASHVCKGLWKKLLPMSAYLAEIAVETDNKDLIRLAIMLHVIEDFDYDYRENFRYLVLIDYAARQIEVSFKAVVDTTKQVASARAWMQLTGFADRDPELNKLSSFQIKATQSAKGFRFEPA